MSGFEENLNVRNCVNLKENCVHYICKNVWICKKIDCREMRKFNGKLCTLNVRNVRICREIVYPELRKLNEKFYTLYMHKICRFAKKLNIQNFENSTGNCIHYTYT